MHLFLNVCILTSRQRKQREREQEEDPGRTARLTLSLKKSVIPKVSTSQRVCGHACCVADPADWWAPTLQWVRQRLFGTSCISVLFSVSPCMTYFLCMLSHVAVGLRESCKIRGIMSALVCLHGTFRAQRGLPGKADRLSCSV